MKYSLLSKKLFEYIYIFLIFSIVFLGRPFTGIIFFGFRLGEVLVGFGLILFFGIALKFKLFKDLSQIFFTHLSLVIILFDYFFFN